MAELDTLEVKIQASATKAVNSVEKLAKKLDTLSTSIGKLDANGINKFASGMTNLANGMNAMKNVKLPDFTRTAKGLKQFENINTAKLRSIANTATPLANGLNAIANVQFNNSGLTNFVNALTRLSNSNISNLNVGVFGQVGNAIVGMSNQLQNAQQVSTNVIQLTNAIARLTGAGQNAVTVTSVLPALGNALRDLFAVMSQAPMVATETTAFTTAIGNLAVAGNKVTATAAGLPALATALRSFFTTMSQAPTVSQNTIQMTQALAQLAAQGSRVGSATRNISSGINSMSASAKSAKPHIKSLTSQLAGLYARVWVVIRAFSWFKKAIDISSDLTEVENVVVNTFGQYSSELEKFSKEAITNYGISELTAKETASRFQAMGIAMGAPVKQMASMSTELTKLSADLASFYNVDQSDAARSLWSVFTGETEPMRKFGLDLTEASLKAYALKNGLDGNISSMTQMEKTMLRYQYVMENTKNVQGDFARTSQNWANQLRILQEQIKAIAGVWGNAFINMLKPLVQALNKALTAVYSFSEKVVNALGAIFGWKLEIQRAAIDDDFGTAADDANSLASGTKKAAKAAKELKTHLLSIDELNVVEPDKDTGDSGTGGSGSGTSGSSAGSDNSLKFKVTETEGAFKSSIKTLKQLGKSISDSLSKSLESINWKKIYKKAKNFGKGLADFLNGLITPRLFYNLGSTIGNSINTALTGANAFAVTFDWKNLGKSMVSSLTGFLNSWDAGLTGKTLSNFAIGICQAILSAVKTIQDDKIWQKIGQKIVDFICGVNWGKLIWNLTTLFATLVKEISNVPYKLFEGVGQSIIDRVFGKGAFDKISKQGWYKVLKKALDIVTTLTNPLKLIATAILKIKEVADKLSPSISKLKTLVEPVLTKIAEKLSGIKTIIGAGFDIIQASTQFVLKVAKTTLVALLAKLKDVADHLKDVLLPIIQDAKKILSPLFDVTKDSISTIFGTLKKIVSTLSSSMKPVLSEVWENYLKPIVSVVGDFLSVVLDKLQKIRDKIQNGILDAFEQLWGVVRLPLSAIVEMITTIYNISKKIVSTILDKLKTALSKIWIALQPILNVVKDVLLTIQNMASRIAAILKDKVFPVIEQIKSATSPSLSKALYALNMVATVIKQIATIIASVLKPVLEKIWSIIKPVVSVLAKINFVLNSAKIEVLSRALIVLGQTVSAVWKVVKVVLEKAISMLEKIWDFIKKISDKVSKIDIDKVLNFGVSSSPFAVLNVLTKTNGKSDKNYKKLGGSIKDAFGVFKSKDVDYNVDTTLNNKEAPNAEAIKTCAKTWQSIWKSITATYNAKTTVNGDNAPNDSLLSGIWHRWTGLWKNKTAKFSVDTAVNGTETSTTDKLKKIIDNFAAVWKNKTAKFDTRTSINGSATTSSATLQNIIGGFGSVWKDKTAKFEARTAVNGTATISASPLKKISDSFMSVFNGKEVKYNVKTQSNKDLQSLGQNAATQIYAGMSDKEISFRLKQRVAADGGDALTKLINGSYSLKFQSYATGGFPEDGWFRASHGEYMGRFDNGQSVVANNEQITGGIAMGVREAVSAILAPYLAEIAQNTRETADKDFTANIDGRSLVNEVDRRRTRNGYSFT